MDTDVQGVHVKSATTVDETSLHLAFLGTRIRALGSDNSVGDTARFASAQVMYDARLSCLLVPISCNHHLNHALVDRLERLFKKTDFAFLRAIGTHSSYATSLPTSASSPSSATSSSAADAPQRSGPPDATTLDFQPWPSPLLGAAPIPPTCECVPYRGRLCARKTRSRHRHARTIVTVFPNPSAER